MNFDFLKNLDGDVLTGTRSGGDSTDPIVRTAPTLGNINIGLWGAKYMKIVDGARIVVCAAPGVAAFPITNPATGQALIMFEGTRSNSEMLAEEYDRTNPLAHKEDSPEGIAHNKAKAEFIEAQLASRGLIDNSHFGAICRKTGNNYQFSSKTPWVEAGGTRTTNAVLKLKRIFGIAMMTDTEGVLLTDDNIGEDHSAAIGFAVINANNAKSPWAGAESLEAVKAVAPCFSLEYVETVDKSGRAPNAKSTTDEAGVEISIGEDVTELVVDPAQAVPTDADLDAVL